MNKTPEEIEKTQSEFEEMEQAREETVIDPGTYNFDYFERGPVCGISGYMNYGWMPEMTMRMAHYLIQGLGIERNHKVLDFGCAKGFLVRAFRVLDYDAHGVDVSEYAIKNVDVEVDEYCSLILGTRDPHLFRRDYDWMIAKDVFEHVSESDLRILMERANAHVKKMFIAVPLAADDDSGKYVIPEYDRDVTHVIAKTMDWWHRLFEDEGWTVELSDYTFDGCKENWTSSWEKGNGFFILSSGK